MPDNEQPRASDIAVDAIGRMVDWAAQCVMNGEEVRSDLTPGMRRRVLIRVLAVMAVAKGQRFGGQGEVVRIGLALGIPRRTLLRHLADFRAHFALPTQRARR